MRFRTIWTIGGMKLSERFRRTRELMAQTIAIHLPQRIRYWVTIQNITKVSCLPAYSQRHPMGITVEEVLKDMPKPVNR